MYTIHHRVHNTSLSLEHEDDDKSSLTKTLSETEGQFAPSYPLTITVLHI